jgi:hypothetical protein
MSSVTRRTIAKGAAWAVPVVGVGAATPAMAASQCTPDVQIVMEGSYRCCATAPLDLQLVLQFADSDTCTAPAGTRWCIDQILLGTSPNPVVWAGRYCGEQNGLPVGPFVICDSPVCTVNLIARIYLDLGGAPQPADYQLVAIKRDNLIPGGLPQGTDCGCSYPAGDAAT